MLQFLRDVLVLGKARISIVAAFTGYAAVAVDGRYTFDWRMIPMCFALFLIGTGANTFNQIIEKNKDAKMSRTKQRRPLPAGRISVPMAISLGAGQVLASCALLWFVHYSWFAVVLALFTFVYYSFFYTMFLKPLHYLNIVVGGVPGSMGPLIAWAAIHPDPMSVNWSAPLAMFLIIFLWTPPHVWALAIRLKEDYAKAGIPMLPVVKGVDETTRQIFIYTVVLVIGTLAIPIWVSQFRESYLYLASSVILGIIFLAWTWRLWKVRPVMPTMPLFRFTLVYIGVLFLGMAIDGIIAGGHV